MAEQFIASNGGVVTVDILGGVRVTPPSKALVWLGGMSSQALREFFQHERDAELGRWRHPTLVNWVAYPQVSEPDVVLVVDESDGFGCVYRRGDQEGHGSKVSVDYFVAHPVRKPWEAARPGEAWVLTVEGEQILCGVEATGPDFVPFAHARWATLARGSERISAGHRVWPEPADAPA